METRIGISGWTYAGWRGTFYPKGLSPREELAYASRKVNSIEINGSFYRLQRPSSYAAWFDATPDDHVFSVKSSRFITHLMRLREPERSLANFLASGVLRLEHKLGPLLWQLPPTFRFDAGLIEDFLRLLPKTTREAAALARHHDPWMSERAWTWTAEDRPLRHAMEIRHPSFETPEFPRLLRDHGVALVLADSAGKWPAMDENTAGFAYARLHGSGKLYVGGYGDSTLEFWAKRVRSWRKERRDVFVYFDNDVKVRAPFDAIRLAKKVIPAATRERRSGTVRPANPASRAGGRR